MNKTNICSAILLSCMLFLAGCAYKTIPLSEKQRNQIKSIKVQQVKEKEIYVNTVNLIGGFGITGRLIAAMENSETSNEISDFNEQNDIKINKLVTKHLIKELQKKNFKIDPANSNTIFVTEINGLGLVRSNFFGTDYSPFILLRGKIIHNGKIIWQDDAFSDTRKDDIPTFKFTEIKKDPRKLIYMFDKAAQASVKRLLTKLMTNDKTYTTYYMGR